MGIPAIASRPPVKDLHTFYFPTNILYGAGAINRLPEELTNRNIHRPLLVTDRWLATAALVSRVKALAGPNAVLFSSVETNPTERNVLDGVAAYKQGNCDAIIGLGGGSALDAGKAIRLKTTHERPLADYDDLRNGSSLITSHIPPYIAVATTAGTGSEVSRSTVITIESTNRKTVVFSPYLMPTLAIEDPELTTSMPPAITAGTGMDAFTHNVEAYLSTPYQPMCDAIALGGVKICWQHLPKVMRDGSDLESRGNMMIAAVMGATAFQKGLGAVHSLAHPLSTDAGMHHGTANAVMLPHVLEYNRTAVEQRMCDLAAQMGAAPKAADTIECVRQLNRVCGIHSHLSAYGITRSMLPKLADKAIQDGCHQLNPRPTTRDDLLRLYEHAL